MKRVEKAWNGGSRDSAMTAARQRVDKMIAQGATLCAACDGAGGDDDVLCPDCQGAGAIVPPGGLRLETTKASEPKWRAVEITFPLAVELPDKWQQRLDQLVGEVCAAYEAAHPDRVMWPFGCGQKMTYMPMTAEEERERGMEFDETTFAIDVAERERYEGERLKPRVPEREKLAVRWARIGYMLAQIYEGEEARLWMGLANRSLGGKRPRECEPEEIEPVLEAMLDAAPVSEVERLRTAIKQVSQRKFSTYRQRGKDVGIEADDGEKVWLVHSDDMHQLEAAAGLAESK